MYIHVSKLARLLGGVMAKKLTIELSDKCDKELKQRTKKLATTQVSIIRNALSLYFMISDEMEESKKKLAFIDERGTTEKIHVPGLI